MYSSGVLKGFSYRAYPTGDQRRALARLFGCCRVVFNDAVQARRDARDRGMPYPGLSELQHSVITQAKTTPDRAWLAQVSNVPLQQSVRDADRAYRNFFDSVKGTRKGPKVGFPRFKSRRGRQSARFTRHAFTVAHTNGCRWGFVTLSKVGRIKIAWSRDLPSDPSSATIILNPDGTYHVSFVVDVPAFPHAEPLREGCGVDLGHRSLASVAGTDGAREKMANLHPLETSLSKLARQQKSLARKQKGSRNYDKQRLKVAKTHAHTAHIRTDNAHKISTRLVRENQLISMEDLDVKALCQGWPSRRQRRAQHDAGWGMLRTLVQQKADERGRAVVLVDPADTSAACAVCGWRNPALGSKHVWTCEGCGAVLDRDWNAAVNILVAAGLAETLNACGGDIRLALVRADPDETGTRRTHCRH